MPGVYLVLSTHAASTQTVIAKKLIGSQGVLRGGRPSVTAAAVAQIERSASQLGEAEGALANPLGMESMTYAYVFGAPTTFLLQCAQQRKRMLQRLDFGSANTRLLRRRRWNDDGAL